MSSARPFFSFFPQFTTDPLNDAAWSPGFTDWDLVRALPDTQRRAFTPARGMYDPTAPDYLSALERELGALSPDAGLAVYHYFFDGRHVLQGFEQQLLAQRSRLPFFICWANETWSKRWVGRPNDIIVAQRHELDRTVIERHATYLARLFELEGYQRHAGRPLLLIYNPQASPTLPRAIALYREAFAALGHRPFFGACLSYPQPAEHITPYDFACEFEPRFFFNSGTQAGAARLAARLKLAFPGLFEWLGAQRDSLRRRAGQREFPYARYLDLLVRGALEPALRQSAGDRPLMRSTFFSWNNTPRYRDRSTIVSHAGVTPAAISDAVGSMRSDAGLPLFVNSWNEWSEGAALEPGVETGTALRTAFLQALGLRA